MSWSEIRDAAFLDFALTTCMWSAGSIYKGVVVSRYLNRHDFFSYQSFQ